MISKSEAECIQDTCHTKDSYKHCIEDVCWLVCNEYLDNLKRGTCNALKDVVDCEWLRVVVKFEAQDLLRVSIDSAVLESPKEAHQVGHTSKFKIDAIDDSDCRHAKHYYNVCITGLFASVFIHYVAYEEAPKDLSKAEQNHWIT